MRLGFLAFSFAVILFEFSAASCAHHVIERASEFGLASWYGADHQGRLTASGEPFDMNEMTAAHRTLPMNCIVRVKSVSTGQIVSVRINDRGPYGKGRIIDLSYQAAKRLGIIEKGTDQVEIQVVSLP